MKASRALALGRLLRLSLAPSAPADVLGGAVLAGGGIPEVSMLACALLGSSCVYHGGLVLNDWADRGEDARTRPDRPLASGALSARFALGLGLGLLLLGPLGAALGARPASGPLALAAGLALLYDLAGRGPWRGPLLLGLCRALNLAAGLALGGGSARLSPLLVAVAASYGLYVFVLSTLARLEDRPLAELARLRPAWRLGLASLALLVPGLLAAAVAEARSLPLPWLCAPFVPLVPGAFTLWSFARARRARAWSGAELEQATGLGLRRLLLVSSALALGAGPPGVLPALVILAGYPLARSLRRVFPPS